MSAELLWGTAFCDFCGEPLQVKNRRGWALQKMFCSKRCRRLFAWYAEGYDLPDTYTDLLLIRQDGYSSEDCWGE